MAQAMGRYTWTGLIIVLLFVLWEVMTHFGKILNPVLFPRPVEVFRALWDSRIDLMSGFLSSMKLFLPAFLLALLLGVAGGLYFGMHDKVREIFMPFFHTLSPIPPTMYIPYAIVLLPTFQTASIFLIFVGAFWPIFLGTIQGVLVIDGRYLDNARALELRGKELIRTVVLPASMPFILNGTGIALGFAFIVLTIAEMFGAKEGMGYFIQYYSDFSDYKNVIAGIFFNCAVILSIMLLFDRIKRRLLFWTGDKS
ncbi:MAG: ABC transporter permease [Bacillus thermozeamaize]|jgi:NitT/TauT family transport system permease protein|uniref:ABC transporter permease n=1 Tax=Bacillus thermozeamaize TaxID=230954 RepID=A0A1Y3PHG9_9BACI|nr:MAG: ABC transporter permease [Bacillus thermozeamaize]